MKLRVIHDGVPIDSLVLVNAHEFRYAGELMAMSLLQNGPLPTVLVDWCYKIISTKTCIEPTHFQPSQSFLERSEIKQVSNVLFLCRKLMKQ